MSRRGNCYDNAVAGSWFETLKAELGSRLNNHSHAKDEPFDDIEVFYNQQRRHSAIGHISPAEYERHRGEPRQRRKTVYESGSTPTRNILACWEASR